LVKKSKQEIIGQIK